MDERDEQEDHTAEQDAPPAAAHAVFGTEPVEPDPGPTSEHAAGGLFVDGGGRAVGYRDYEISGAEDETAGYTTEEHPTPAHDGPVYDGATYDGATYDGAAYDGDYPGEDGAVDEAEDDEDDDERRGLPAVTKVGLVVAAWLLLVLFLIGQFRQEDETPVVGLDQTTLNSDAAAGSDEAEEAVADVGDGGGTVETADSGYPAVSTLTGAASAEGTSGGGGSGASGTGGTGDRTDQGPGAEPVAGSSTSTTAKASGTTSTVPASTGAGASTTAPPTTAPPPTNQAAEGATIRITSNCKFDVDSVGVRSGETVVFINETSGVRRIKPAGQDVVEIAAGASTSFSFSTSTSVGCRKGDTNDDTVIIDVN